MTVNKRTIGILETDNLKPVLAKKYLSYFQLFLTFFAKVDPAVILHRYSVIEGQYPDKLDACDAYIITGSNFSAYDNIAWIHTLNRFISGLFEADKKMIGICFGHQLLAHSLGGKVVKSPLG